MEKNIINMYSADGLPNMTTINIPTNTTDREIVLFGPTSNTLLGSGIISDINKNIAPVNSVSLVSNSSNPSSTNTVWNKAGVLYLGPNAIGPVTLAPVGSTSNANGATLAAGILNLQPANVSNPGVVTTGTQSFSGDKVFTRVVAGDLQIPGQAAPGATIPIVGPQSGGGDVMSYLPTQKPYSTQSLRMAMYTDGTGINSNNPPVVTWPIARASGGCHWTGQTLSLTPTLIALGALDTANKQGITVTASTFTLTQPGDYCFHLQPFFSTGSNEWKIIMQSNTGSGYIANWSHTGITATSALGSTTGSVSFPYNVPIGSAAVSLQFLILGQSYPAGSFPSVTAASNLAFTYTSPLDLSHTGDWTTL